MKTLIITVMILIVPTIANAFSISCNYETGEQICNGKKIKDTKECKDKNIYLSSVLFIGMIGRGANDIAKKEYNDALSCIEFVGKKKKKLKKIAVGNTLKKDKEMIINLTNHTTYPAEVPFYQGMSLMPGQSAYGEIIIELPKDE